jgi:two-component system sensor histidine kinase/response regulator
MRLLIVDDDTSFRRSLVIGLEEAGHRVYEAHNGVEALEFLETDQAMEDGVEAVIIDARMPGVDGFWLTDQIRKMYPSLRCIILSAYTYPDKSGNYTVLSKPINLSRLTDVLMREGFTFSQN